jgi:hypothetical protein
VARVTWRPTYRLVASRFPPVSLFERITDPEELDVIFTAESRTNPRLREEAGELQLVAPADRVTGPGTTPIMAAFTHLNPAGSRFSDGTYGVYYAGIDVDTAIAETAHHQARFLRESGEQPIEVDMRCYLADIDVDLIELRGEQARRPDLYLPDNYAASQAFGREHRAGGADGIVWDSVRHAGGQCVGIFRPRCISPCMQGAHYAFVWDGTRIAQTYQKSDLTPLI